mmetsp:Transcript_18876/g.61605  ORF Transcript_18876/g.61605 Transcript_18876/m.61605 type:complete len:460 (-) Transcript_18876:35-1414(-)
MSVSALLLAEELARAVRVVRVVRRGWAGRVAVERGGERSGGVAEEVDAAAHGGACERVARGVEAEARGEHLREGAVRAEPGPAGRGVARVRGEHAHRRRHHERVALARERDQRDAERADAPHDPARLAQVARRVHEALPAVRRDKDVFVAGVGCDGGPAGDGGRLGIVGRHGEEDGGSVRDRAHLGVALCVGGELERRRKGRGEGARGEARRVGAAIVEVRPVRGDERVRVGAAGGGPARGEGVDVAGGGARERRWRELARRLGSARNLDRPNARRPRLGRPRPHQDCRRRRRVQREVLHEKREGGAHVVEPPRQVETHRHIRALEHPKPILKVVRVQIRRPQKLDGAEEARGVGGGVDGDDSAIASDDGFGGGVGVAGGGDFDRVVLRAADPAAGVRVKGGVEELHRPEVAVERSPALAVLGARGLRKREDAAVGDEEEAARVLVPSKVAAVDVRHRL